MTSPRGVLQRAILVLALAPVSVTAQSATVRARENLRALPNGDVIGVLEPGLGLAPVGRREQWLEVDVEGWVWMRSLQTTTAGGHDLVVSAEEGENLRAGPSGAILGKLDPGTLLDELEREPGWIRVRRRGWIWAPSVDSAATPVSAAPSAAAGSRAAAPVPTPPGAAARGGAGGVPPTAPPATRVPSSAGSAILSGPNGDTLARTRPGTALQVLARDGSWARVRVEGWAWMPAGDSASAAELVDATPAQLAAEPDRYRGQMVTWDLQFLSLERAERIRTEFFEGEPFLLTRHPAGGYVYVAVPPDRIAEARTLLPLERLTVTARIRVPASALTGSPILDLVEVARARDRR